MGNALGLEDNAPPLFEIPSCQEFCVASTGRHGSGGAGASCGNMVQCDIHCEDPDDRRMRERTLLQHAVKTQLPAFGVRLPRGAQLQNSLPRIEVWKDREAASSSSSTSSTSLSTSRSTASGSSASISGGSAATSSALFPGGDTGGDIDVRVPQQAGGWLQVSDDEDTEEEEVHICTQDSVLNFSARGLNCVLTVLFNQKSSVQGANKSITFPATVEVEPRQEPLEQLHAAVHSVPEELQSDENRRHSKIDYKFYHLSIPSGNPKSVHFKLDRLDHDCAMQFQLDPDFGVQLNGLDILPLMFLERAFYEDDVQGLLMMSAGSCTGGPRVSTSSSALSSTASGSGGGKIVSQAAAPPHPYRGGGVMNQMNSSATRFSPSPGKGSIGRSSSSSSTPSLNMVVEQDINMATSSSLQLEPQPEPPTSSLVEPHRLPPLPGPRRSSRSLSPQRLQAKTAHAVRDGWVCTVPGLYTMKNEVELELRGMTGCEEVSLYLNGGEAVLETQVGLSNDFRKFKYTITPLAYRLHSLDLLLRFRATASSSAHEATMQPCAVISRRVGVLCRGKQNILPSTCYYPLVDESGSSGGGGGDFSSSGSSDQSADQVVQNGILRRPGIYRMMPYGKMLKTLIDEETPDRANVQIIPGRKI